MAWSETHLGAHVEHMKGFAFKSALYVDQGKPVARVSDFGADTIDLQNCVYIDHSLISDFIEYELRLHDVLITTVGSWPQNPASVVAKVVRVTADAEGALLNQNAVRLRSKPSLDQRFLYYLLKNPSFKEYIVGTAQGSASQASITLKDIFAYKTQLPDKECQKKIANVLTALDDKIELNRKMNETLEQMARAIFKSWFIDFDPVRAKRDGKKPFGMDDATAALFPNSLEQSELGEIPKGWTHGQVSELFSANTWTLSKNDKLSCIDYIEISGVSSGQINEVATYPQGKEPSRAKRRLKHFDTVLSTVRPDRAAYFLAFRPKETHIASTGFAVLTATHQNDSLFGHVCVTMKEFFDELGRLADGGAYPAIRPEVILSRPTVLPPKSLREIYHRLVEPMITLIKENQNESETLGKTRDLLLPRLLSGEINV